MTTYNHTQHPRYQRRFSFRTGEIFSRFSLTDKTSAVKLLIIHGCPAVILHKTIDNNSLSYRWISIHLALSFSYPRVTDAF